jgi:hypothetical protein
MKVVCAGLMHFSKQNRLENRIKQALDWSTSIAAASLQQPQAASTLSAKLRTA